MNQRSLPHPSAELSTRSFGRFNIEIRTASWSQRNDILLSKGAPAPGESILCRVTTACTLSTAFDASDCDCRDQLRVAMALISAEGRGAVIYLDQEGRGHGIHTKIRALRNKNKGRNTIEAVEDLGLESDVTNYQDIPTYLGTITAGSVRLLTNNPAKVEALARLGVDIADVVPCVADVVHPDTRRHLEAKRSRGHTLPGL
jgi:GTP cyclohydrolase II